VEYCASSEIELEHIDPWFTEKAKRPSLGVRRHNLSKLCVADPALTRHTRNLKSAAAGVMCGSKTGPTITVQRKSPSRKKAVKTS